MNLFDKIYHTLMTVNNLPLFMANKLHLMHGYVICSTRQGLLFLLRSGTPDMDEIIVDLSYHVYNFTLLTLPKKPTIIDLGAHIGSFSLFCKSIYPNAQVVAIEPESENYKLLRINMLLNNLDISVFNIAIGVKNSTGYIQKNNIPTDAYVVKPSKSIDAQQCEIWSLHKLLTTINPKTVDVLKIDIEGMEYDLIHDRQSLSIIQKHVHYLFIEHHNQDSKGQWLLQKLNSHFECIAQADHVLTFENKFH